METREYTTINRTALGWPDGPWNGEPDKVQWQDQQTGMPCLAVRHPESGHWCGYVGVDPDHPHFEQSYDDVSMAPRARYFEFFKSDDGLEWLLGSMPAF